MPNGLSGGDRFGTESHVDLNCRKGGGISDPGLEEGGRLRVCVIGNVWRCRLNVNETDIDRVLGEST